VPERLPVQRLGRARLPKRKAAALAEHVVRGCGPGVAPLSPFAPKRFCGDGRGCGRDPIAGVAGPNAQGHVARMQVPRAAFRSALGAFATGVCVVTTRDASGKPAGVTVNSFTSVSLEPPLVLFCLDRRGSALARFGAAPAWAVHVLAEGQEDLARCFARPSREAALSDPWSGIAWAEGEDGLPRLAGCLARLSCTAERVTDGGDHAILIGRVAALEWQAEGRPLLYFRGRFEAASEGLTA
jgi:flavin reductase (DIM6/NTAB) family NADH-FMN oxidoreductase RutF